MKFTKTIDTKCKKFPYLIIVGRNKSKIRCNFLLSSQVLIEINNFFKKTKNILRTKLSKTQTGEFKEWKEKRINLN